MKIDLEQMLITDGYVDSYGKTYETPTADDLEKAIIGAMEMTGKSRDEIVVKLEAGKAIKWCKSPNFYYDHSYGVIGRKRQSEPVEMMSCDCGHSVPRDQVMNTSEGTSCPDCYDNLSN